MLASMPAQLCFLVGADTKENSTFKYVECAILLLQHGYCTMQFVPTGLLACLDSTYFRASVRWKWTMQIAPQSTVSAEPAILFHCEPQVTVGENAWILLFQRHEYGYHL